MQLPKAYLYFTHGDYLIIQNKCVSQSRRMKLYPVDQGLPDSGAVLVTVSSLFFLSLVINKPLCWVKLVLSVILLGQCISCRAVAGSE